MKKTLAKILIILGLAFGLGRTAVTYTIWGAEFYSKAKSELKGILLNILDAEPKNSELDPYLQTPAEQLSGLYTTGIIASSGSVDSSVLQERLNYYREHKETLWE